MFEALTSDKQLTLERQNGDYLLAGKAVDFSLKSGDHRQYTMQYEGKQYKVDVLELDPISKEVTLRINGKKTHVKIRSKMEKLLKRLGLENALATKLDALYAPMPGLIHDILVSPGEKVEAGTPLIILEAMKMENVIKSPGAGVISKVEVEKTDSVDKGALLLNFE
ncbi:MAG: biotin/lipoyl-containing protein [Bacteroidota bacterium]